MKKPSQILRIAALSLIFFSPFVQAFEQDEISYEALIKELKGNTSTALDPLETPDPLNQVMFHGSVALTTSYLVVTPEAGGNLNGLMRGIELGFGIDLLSRNWMAEGSVRSYQPENLNRETQVALREFDLRLVYHDQFARNMRYRMGGGLTSRYLTFNSRDGAQINQEKYTTPSSLFFIGAQVSLGPRWSIGPDVAYRSTLVDETVDKRSFDANLRVSAHF